MRFRIVTLHDAAKVRHFWTNLRGSATRPSNMHVTCASSSLRGSRRRCRPSSSSGLGTGTTCKATCSSYHDSTSPATSGSPSHPPPSFDFRTDKRFAATTCPGRRGPWLRGWWIALFRVLDPSPTGDWAGTAPPAARDYTNWAASQPSYSCGKGCTEADCAKGRLASGMQVTAMMTVGNVEINDDGAGNCVCGVHLPHVTPSPEPVPTKPRAPAGEHELGRWRSMLIIIVIAVVGVYGLHRCASRCSRG